jgi:hypothetical protein
MKEMVLKGSDKITANVSAADTGQKKSVMKLCVLSSAEENYEWDT